MVYNMDFTDTYQWGGDINLLDKIMKCVLIWGGGAKTYVLPPHHK